MARIFSIQTAATVACLVVPALALADHDRPAKSAGIKVGLVRAYAPCVVPNTEHDEVVVYSDACGPATPLSSYRFGPKGQGRAQIKTVADGLQMRFALRDVHNVGDEPVGELTFRGRFTLRMTDHGCSSSPSCTVESGFSVTIPCSNGRCAVSQTYPHAFLPVGLEGSLEVVRVDVFDPNDALFATQGILVDFF